MDEIRDLNLLNFWRHPAGTVGGPACAIIAFACVVTVAIAAVGARIMWSYYDCSAAISPWWFRNGLAILACAALVLAALPPWRLSRGLRVAVVLPFVHAIVMVVAWVAWGRLIGVPSSWHRASVLIEVLPIGATAAGAGVKLVASAWLIARRRRGELGHALVMLALAELLLFGLWLPIASALWCRELHGGIDGPQVVTLIGFVLGPPWVVACAFTAIAVRRPRVLPRIRIYVAVGLFGLFGSAVATRITRAEDLCIVFGNFIHVLLAVAFVAVMALAVLGVRIWLRDRHARYLMSGASMLTGVVAAGDDDGDVVVSVEITSWLRGPRAMLRPFSVTTRAGDVPVPGGTWVGPLSTTTTQLRTGESVSALRCGDTVVVAGLVAGPSGDRAHPFRSSPALTAGAGGISIAHASAERHGFANVALALWRPCVAYLAILIAIGIPGLVAALLAP